MGKGTITPQGTWQTELDGGGHGAGKVKAPVPKQWFGSLSLDSVAFEPHPLYGFACPILKPDVDVPSS